MFPSQNKEKKGGDITMACKGGKKTKKGGRKGK